MSASLAVKTSLETVERTAAAANDTIRGSHHPVISTVRRLLSRSPDPLDTSDSDSSIGDEGDALDLTSGWIDLHYGLQTLSQNINFEVKTVLEAGAPGNRRNRRNATSGGANSDAAECSAVDEESAQGIMRRFFVDHITKPYPSKAEKVDILKRAAEVTPPGEKPIKDASVALWFINQRRRSGWTVFFRTYALESHDKMCRIVAALNLMKKDHHAGHAELTEVLEEIHDGVPARKRQRTTSNAGTAPKSKKPRSEVTDADRCKIEFDAVVDHVAVSNAEKVGDWVQDVVEAAAAIKAGESLSNVLGNYASDAKVKDNLEPPKTPALKATTRVDPLTPPRTWNSPSLPTRALPPTSPYSAPPLLRRSDPLFSQPEMTAVRLRATTEPRDSPLTKFSVPTYHPSPSSVHASPNFQPVVANSSATVTQVAPSASQPHFGHPSPMQASYFDLFPDPAWLPRNFGEISFPQSSHSSLFAPLTGIGSASQQAPATTSPEYNTVANGLTTPAMLAHQVGSMSGSVAAHSETADHAVPLMAI